MTPYYDSEYVTIFWDEALKSPVMDWKKFADGEDYRTPLRKVLELMKQHNSDSILGDTVNMRVVAQADQEWTAVEWSKLAIEAGLRKSLIVIPISPTAKMGLNRMVTKAHRTHEADVETLYFDDLEEARRWLQEYHS